MKNLLFIILSPLCLFAQQLKVGDWIIHSPYRDAISVTEAQNRIYCASNSGLFYYDKSDGKIERITKLSGLSDIQFSTIKYLPNIKSLVIGYKNGNIDFLFDDGSIRNYSDIKRKQIVGQKNINHIFYHEDKIYFSCGFGVVVFNAVKKEFEDTYFLTNMGQAEVFAVTANGGSLYAATKNGLFKGLMGGNLNDFSNWASLSSAGFGLPGGSYNGVVSLQNKIFASFSYHLSNNFSSDSSAILKKDTLYVIENNTWTYLDSSLNNIKKIEVNAGKLAITTSDKQGIFYDSLGTKIKLIKNYWYFDHPNEFLSDKDGTYWIADKIAGLLRYQEGAFASVLIPNGPFSKLSFCMKMVGENLYVATGIRDASSSGTFNTDFITFYKNRQWGAYNIFNMAGLGSIFDVISIEVDPNNENHLFVASWGRKGVLEILNGVLVNHYYGPPSTLENYPGLTDLVFTGGLRYDQHNNLWMINSFVPNPISVRKADGSWKSFAYGIPENELVHDLFIDSYNQKWVVLPKTGILVFNDNGTIDNESDDAEPRIVKLNLNTGSGIQQAAPICMAEDKEGAMWIGTNYGIAIIYSAADVLNPSEEVQQILVEKDGIAQYLLETEAITAMVIDGANRKWIGTSRNGLFLLSPDGTKEIHHYTAENSPLLSDQITALALQPTTGELFIGTSEGMVSYRTSATDGTEEFEKVYAFPNPVPPGYEGIISITGLIANANVKITDINGKLVYETKSEGGQASWNGKNLNGDKISSGVYLVFCANEDGEKTYITKILFFN